MYVQHLLVAPPPIFVQQIDRFCKKYNMNKFHNTSSFIVDQFYLNKKC